MPTEEQRLSDLLKRVVPEPTMRLSANRVTARHASRHAGRSPRPWLIPALATVAVAAAAGGFLATSGGSGTAVGTPRGTATAASGSPAYSVAKHADGSITLDVYRESGYAAADARLRQMGDKQLVVVPFRSGCPSIGSLPKPAVSAEGRDITVYAVGSPGSVTVSATGVPAGDIMVIGLEVKGDSTFGATILTSGSAPSCISGSAVPGGAGSASGIGYFGSGSGSPPAGG